MATRRNRKKARVDGAREDAPKTAKAHGFHVVPKNGSCEEIARLLQNFVAEGKGLHFTQDETRYFAVDGNMRGMRQNIFTVTIYKLRTTELPSAVGTTGVKPLELPEEIALGEPMCLAYDPSSRKAVVQSVGYGPRYAILRTLIQRLGFDSDVDVDPILRGDMLERLRHFRVCTRLDVTIRDPRHREALREIGVMPESALAALDDIEGGELEMKFRAIRKKRPLTLEKVVTYARSLLKFRDTDVTRIRVHGSEDEHEKIKMLDIMGGREEWTVELRPVGREWDRLNCQEQLALYLQELESEHPSEAEG